MYSDTIFLEEEINKSDTFYYLDGKELTLDEVSDLILNTPEEEVFKLEDEGRLVKREKEYVQPGVALWLSLIKKGLSEKVSDNQYRFTTQQSSDSDSELKSQQQQPSSTIEKQIAELEKERDERILKEQEVSRVNYVGTDGTIRQVRTYGDGSRKTFAIDENSGLATELTQVSKKEEITNEELADQMLQDEFTVEVLPIKEGRGKAISISNPK